ncbi:hypothetical protein HPY42_04970 [Coprothermobacteraceae bacterium]|nr:hypothetical protein [Coprothermobacteraceae bacterium]
MGKVLLNWSPSEKDLNLMQSMLVGHDLRPTPWTPSDIAEAQVLIYSNRTPELDDLIPQMKSLKLIQSYYAGVDHLPWKKIPREVMVAAGTGANSEAVADMAVALMLSALRHLYLYDAEMRLNVWRRRPGKDTDGLKVTVLGTGSIGQAIARRLKSMNAVVTGVSRSGAAVPPFDHVLTVDSWIADPQGDVVIIALPLNKGTKNLINAAVLNKMPNGTLIVNIARAAIVEPESLYRWLTDNPNSVYASDVWWNEVLGTKPTVVEQPVPIESLKNVVMAPHVAGFTQTTQIKVLRVACENVGRFLAGQPPLYLVNHEDYEGLEE